MIVQPGDAKRIILQVSPSDLDGSNYRQKPEETIAFKSLSQIASNQAAGEDYACWLIYTEQSAKTAAFLKQYFSNSFRFDDIGSIESMDNALKIFELVMQIASDPINAERSVICDCTGGTKTMSIALALACNHHKLTSESQTELILTFIPSENNGSGIAFHKYDLSRVIAEEQQRYIDQQKRIGRLRHLARLSPILAHEIKNPLNLISADLHLLRDQPVDAYAKDLLREIGDSVKEIDLFKPMRRGKNSPGTGMGLNIVKSFVTEEGGTITYDDSYESGARFVIELPILPMNGSGHDENLNGG